ncbi:MAG: hypothetical protein NDJ90_14395, partial [Oligoflexia bacterium]|nr:hypothetical protein [Oligoflexia bacterium]
ALARAAAQAPGANAILPRHNGQHGHPVWLSWSFLEKLAELAPTAPDARLDAQIKALPDAARLSVEVSDSRILLNLNTPEDFAKL